MRIGIDLGGTKIEAVVLDKKGTVIFRKRKPTPKGDYNKTLTAISTLVVEAEKTVLSKNKLSLGVAIPGAESLETGLIKNSNSLCLIGKNLKKDLSTLLNREVRLANDANCFALSEATDGIAQNFYSVFGVIIGTGCGGGISIGRKILVGNNSIAGEWGHNPMPWPTKDELKREKCYCGKKLCNELFLSGTGLEQDYYLATGKKISAVEIGETENTNKNAKQALDRYKDRFARAISTVINLIDPDAIVLGGGVSNIKSLYSDIPVIMKKYIFSPEIRTQILKAKYGDSSGVRGAAWLWPEK